MPITRASVFQSSLVHIRHVTVRPDPAICSELQAAPADMLALPLSGVFAKHVSRRHHVIANSSHALFFGAGEPYRLSFPDGIGDECLTLEFAPGADQPQFRGEVLLPAQAILQRCLLWSDLRAGAAEPILVEETASRLIAQLSELAAGAGISVPKTSRRSATALRRRRQVESVKEALSARPAQSWTLDALAKVALSSPFHLARVFREESGTTIHRYLTRARLTASLEPLLESDADVGAIALDAGFASHSHYTASFRATFGLTPAALRRKSASRTLAQLRKNVTAPSH